MFFINCIGFFGELKSPHTNIYLLGLHYLRSMVILSRFYKYFFWDWNLAKYTLITMNSIVWEVTWIIWIYMFSFRIGSIRSVISFDSNPLAIPMAIPRPALCFPPSLLYGLRRLCQLYLLLFSMASLVSYRAITWGFMFLRF